MAAGRDRFYFPPPVDIDNRRGTQETINQIAGQLATQTDIGGLDDRISVTDGQIVQISEAQLAANERLDDLEQFAGTGVTTPIWTSIGGRDIVTFPDTAMLRVEHQDRDTK